MKRFLLTLTLLMTMSAAAFAASAIAIRDEAGVTADNVGYGIGRGSSQTEADGAALRNCQSAQKRASGCDIKVQYAQCGAYAASDTFSGEGIGATKETAIAAALKSCGKGCKVAVADCEPAK